MIIVTPYRLSASVSQNKNKGASKKASPAVPSFGLKFSSSYSSRLFPTQIQTPSNLLVAKTQETSFEWIKDANISKAIEQLKTLKFEDSDVKHLQSLGAVIPFASGEAAVRFINNSNTRIKFEALPSPEIHAMYDFDENCIKINEVYRNTQNQAEILAIAEAILHEAGHAKDNDGITTVQEEINCLSMNALSHRVFNKQYPDVFATTNSLIVKDGVCVYADLFFDNDPLKSRLTERLKKKYGDLQAGDLTHPPSDLAFKVKGL